MAPKRSFYEDDEYVTTKPGVNVEITPELKEKESAHGEISFIQGMGVRTTPYLEKHANAARLYVHDKLSILNAELLTQVTAVRNELDILKHKFDQAVLDPLFPGLVNLVFPILVTNVVVARRSLPVRFGASAVAAVLAMKYSMPRTYEHSKHGLIAWEKENIPEVYEQQGQLKQQLSAYSQDATKAFDQAKADLQKSIHDARVSIAKAFEED